MQNRAKKAMELADVDEPRSEKSGLPPQSTKSAKTANSARKRPPSGKASRKHTEESKNEGDTFLTDMLFKGEGKGQQRRQNKATFQSAAKPQLSSKGSSRTRQGNNKTAQRDERVEDQSNADSDLEDEYKDMVFDFD